MKPQGGFEVSLLFMPKSNELDIVYTPGARNNFSLHQPESGNPNTSAFTQKKLKCNKGETTRGPGSSVRIVNRIQ